jgi:glyoxylase-like metal-dependent hydrolase (beta-lactamase superfamily II)
MHVEVLVVGAFEVNCVVIWGDQKKALVFDPGEQPDRVKALLADNSLSVAAYLLTHGHVDHISALAALHADHPAPVGIHAADLQWAFDPRNQMPPFYGPPARPARIERLLEDGQEWIDGGLVYNVIATPGHTPGSVSFFFPDNDLLVSGDTLFAGSVGRTDLEGGDARTLAASLERIGGLPGRTSVYPGHGPTTRIDREKQTNYFMQSKARAR